MKKVEEFLTNKADRQF